jgi:hypothetical protein
MALGQLGWTLRRIEAATGVRRETAGVYLKAAGLAVRLPGRWGPPAAKSGQRGVHRPHDGGGVPIRAAGVAARASARAHRQRFVDRLLDQVGCHASRSMRAMICPKSLCVKWLSASGRMEYRACRMRRPPVLNGPCWRRARDWTPYTRELVFEPLEFLERLAAMTPRPEINLLICHGVLAPHARHARRRWQVVSYGRPPPVQGQSRLFTITDLRVHHPDPGVHHERSGCSRCTDLRVHLRPIRAFTFDRYAQSWASGGRRR